jgi:hypothetical protein
LTPIQCILFPNSTAGIGSHPPSHYGNKNSISIIPEFVCLMVILLTKDLLRKTER